MPRFVLTNRDDVFDTRHEPGWHDGSRVYGGNGSDKIFVFGDDNFISGGNGQDVLVAIGDGNTLEGGNGKDDLRATGDDNQLLGGNGKDSLRVVGDDNQLVGGNGADILQAVGEGNVMDGGNGVDRLFSVSHGRFFQIGEGNVLTGGHGVDIFRLNNHSDLRVINDLRHPPGLPPGPGPGVGVVNDGDIIVGVMDEITDYRAGELVDIRAHQEASTPVEINGPGFGANRLDLADGEYAFIRGDQIANGRFKVDDDGGDMLLVYDASGGGDALFLQGAVVLQGVTDADSVVIA